MKSDVYLRRLAQILKEKVPEKKGYWIIGSDDKTIVGETDFFNIEPDGKNWKVYFQERGTVYKSYTCQTEREACVKFIEMTEDEYHLSRYLSEFEEKKTA